MAADQDFEPSPRDIPGIREDTLDGLGDRRIHAPGGSVVVTVPIVMPGGGGGGRGGRGRGRWRDRDREPIVPPPTPLPMTGNELLDVFAAIPGFSFLRRASISILDYIRQFWPQPYSWKMLNVKADTVATLLFTVGSQDQVGELVISAVCKSADGGASTGTLTVTFIALDDANLTYPSPMTQTCDLTTVGSGGTLGQNMLLAAGSGVTFDFTGGGTYGAASYDVIVSWIPKSSDKPGNQINNILR